MAPKPVATARPIDIVAARPRPMLSVAIALAQRGESRYRYSEASGVERVRFVAQVPARSTLWALRDENDEIVHQVNFTR